MDKALYSASILFALVLMAGSSFFPNNAIMWLASTSLLMDVARGIIVVMMVGLMLTKPPRSLLFRALLGAVGLVMTMAAIIPISQGSIHILDVLLAAEAAVAFLLAAIEAEPEPQPDSTLDRLPNWLSLIPQSILIPIAVQYVRLTAALAQKLEESAGMARPPRIAPKHPWVASWPTGHPR